MGKLIISDRFEMIKQDWEKVIKNALIFSSPSLIAFLLALQGGGDLNFALGAGYSAMLGIVIDILKKFISSNSYRSRDK